ncbi:hypothetical protein POM88_052410 [Heracleum sosnowskyi]|uniref:Uncharacterized protein n=1 Tax=Heracleum sosnowskyi TaxID=360622 RepID=A0AAD8GSA7_9APIA|nr:hypothetical protein POM88_052410 [Heracleum sosnowskyi]
MRRNNIIKPRDKSNNRFDNSSTRAAKSASHLHFAPQIQDTSGERKRKFPEPRRNNLQEIGPSASSEQCEPVQEPRSDGAKTSEYAYFKKLKKEATQSELYPREREKSQFTNVETNHYEREKTTKLKQKFVEPKSSVPIGTERSIDHPCLTPLVCASKSSEMINMVESSDKDMIFPLLNEKGTPSNHNDWPSVSQSYPRDAGVQHCDKGIFALKRQRLRQWVSGTIHQEIGELSSEGFSLVSVLLNRLFTEDNKENCDWEPKNSQAEISAQDRLPLFPDDNTHSRGHYGFHKNHLMEFDDAPYEDYCFTQYLPEHRRDVVLPELENVGAESPLTAYPIKPYPTCKDIKPYHKIDASITENLFPESKHAQYRSPSFLHHNTHSRGHYQTHTNHLVDSENAAYEDYCYMRHSSECHSDVILPELDNAEADFPSTTYPLKTYLPCTYVKPNLKIDASFTESLFPESNSSFLLQSEKYGSIAWADHLKNFDKCHDPNSSLLQAEPHALLLGWDYSNDKDEQGLSISSYNGNMNLLTRSRDNDHWQSHDRQDESALLSSYLLSSYFLNCNLTQPSSANFCSARDSGRYLEYENYLYAKLDHFPVSSSCNPDSLKYLCGPSEDFPTNNQLETRNAVLSTRDHFWNLNRVICEDNFSDQEPLFFSTSLDREVGEKHLRVSDSSTENQLSMVPAYQNPQLVGPAACFLGEEDKESFLYNPRCTSDFSDSFDFQDLSALNIQRPRDNGVSTQRHSILERHHPEADDDSECEF